MRHFEVCRAERPPAEWIGHHPDAYPHTIIICDGYFTDGDAEPVAAQVKKLRTNDGSVLLFTVPQYPGLIRVPFYSVAMQRVCPILRDDNSKEMFRLA